MENQPKKIKLSYISESNNEKDSASKFETKETKTIKIKKKNKKGKKKKKGLKKLEEIEVKESKITKFSLGQIKYAEMHRQATRPLRHIKDLTEEEIKEYSCPCCGLPSQVTGKLEPYKMCDNPDDFSNCGQGVVLYYSYIKFVIFITFVATVGISGINTYFSYKYTNELRKVCNDYYHNLLVPHNNLYLIEECKFYFTEADENSEYYGLIDSFFFQFSSPNVKDYRKLIKKINPKNYRRYNN